MLLVTRSIMHMCILTVNQRDSELFFLIYSGVMVAAGGVPPEPPAYKEKDDLGPEFGIPMPPPPSGPPPSYRGPGSVAGSVASGPALYDNPTYGRARSVANGSVAGDARSVMSGRSSR